MAHHRPLGRRSRGCLRCNGRFPSDALTNEATATNDPESIRGVKLLEERLRGPAANQRGDHRPVSRTGRSMTPPSAAYVEGIRADVAALGPDVIVSMRRLTTRRTSQDLVFKDRHATLIPFTMAGDVDEATENIPEFSTSSKSRTTGAVRGLTPRLRQRQPGLQQGAREGPAALRVRHAADRADHPRPRLRRARSPPSADRVALAGDHRRRLRYRRHRPAVAVRRSSSQT